MKNQDTKPEVAASVESAEVATAETTSEEKKPSFFKKAADFSKRVTGGISDGIKAMSDKNKAKKLQKELEKYRPVFPEQYSDSSFHLPNMIMIIDDAVHRDVEVCQGAIGCLANKGGMEVFTLYDEYVAESKIEFVPSANCNAVYYVDNFDRNRYIRVDCIFSKAHEERLAELEHIAYSLGAKCCSIEIVESESEFNSATKKVNNESTVSDKTSKSGREVSMKQSSSNQRSGKTVTLFEGHAEPKVPTLKWFAYDDNIKRLIEMRCTEIRSVKSKTLELSGSSSAALSTKAAYAIDAALASMNNKTNVALEKQAIRENSCKLIFEVDF